VKPKPVSDESAEAPQGDMGDSPA